MNHPLVYLAVLSYANRPDWKPQTFKFQTWEGMKQSVQRHMRLRPESRLEPVMEIYALCTDPAYPEVVAAHAGPEGDTAELEAKMTEMWTDAWRQGRV